MRISLVTPAYQEEENLPLLHSRLLSSLPRELEWEWIIVDDHSSDQTYSVIQKISQNDPRVRGIRLARNFGSHAAIVCGLREVRGSCAVVLAADLQDPPESISRLIELWGKGHDVIWAVRDSSPTLSKLFYVLTRRLEGVPPLHSTGSDFFLLDKKVIQALRQFPEGNTNLLALIQWMGFKQTQVTYQKNPRRHGQSKWNLRKRIKLAVDSVTSFTYSPIRLMSYTGFVTALFGFCYAGYVTLIAFQGTPPAGWSSLIIAILVIGGIQMIMMGILGEYLWRALDESRRRPRFIIEASTDNK